MIRQSRFLATAMAMALVPLALGCDDSLTGPDDLPLPGGESGSATFVIEPARFQIEVGETIRLTAVYGDQVVQGTQVSWRSSAPAVAEVVDGLARGLSEGQATITARYANNIARARVHVIAEREAHDDGRIVPER